MLLGGPLVTSSGDGVTAGQNYVQIGKNSHDMSLVYMIFTQEL